MSRIINVATCGDSCSSVDSAVLTDRFRPVTACWVCNSARLRRVLPVCFDFEIYRSQDPELAEYSGETQWLNQCRDCGFMQPGGLPTLPDFFARMYDTRWSPEWVAQEFSAEYREPIFQTVLRELGRRMTRRPRKLLDVGAHVGKLVHLASQAGWDAEGIELNPTTAAFAARQTGRPMHQQTAAELADSGLAFDAITILDVLEHIPEPLPVLTDLRRLLSPGGWIAVKVPCGRSQLRKEQACQWLRPGYRINLANNLVHVNHFTPASLKLVLERAGFSRVRIEIGMPERLPLRSPYDLPGLVSRWFRRTVHFVGSHVPGGVHTPLALNLQAFARRD